LSSQDGLIERIPIDPARPEDSDVRFFIGVLVIALVAMSMPAGPCCVQAKSTSHACCRTQCLSAAPAATVVKAPAVFALLIAPAPMRLVAVVTDQRLEVTASTRPLECIAPFPLRI